MNCFERRIEVLKKQIEEQEQLIREEKIIKKLIRRRFDRMLKVVQNNNSPNLTIKNDLINLIENKTPKKI
jgi:hypothetical protein